MAIVGIGEGARRIGDSVGDSVGGGTNETWRSVFPNNDRLTGLLTVNFIGGVFCVDVTISSNSSTPWSGEEKLEVDDETDGSNDRGGVAVNTIFGVLVFGDSRVSRGGTNGLIAGVKRDSPDSTI